MPRYAELIYNGFWFSPEREALQSLIDKTNEFATGVSASVRDASQTSLMRLVLAHALGAGTVRVKLYKGNVIVTGRKSPVSLYDKVIASFEDDKGLYNQVRPRSIAAE